MADLIIMDVTFWAFEQKPEMADKYPELKANMWVALSNHKKYTLKRETSAPSSRGR